MKYSLSSSGNVAVIDVSIDSREDAPGFLLMSDLHLDNKHCKRKLLKRHLDIALENGYPVLLNGDTLCLMQGKNDKRSSKTALRQAHIAGPYFDRVVEDAVKFLKPYAHLIYLIGEGNHENAVRDKLEFDVLKMLVTGLRAEGSPVVQGGYGGWIVIRVTYTNHRSVFKIAYFHGAGGGGVITKGMLTDNRLALRTEGADMIWQGHYHEFTYAIHMTQHLPSFQGEYKVKQRVLHMLKTPTYKDEYADGSKGWHVETGKPPKPLGCALLQLTTERSVMAEKLKANVSWLQ